MLAQAFCDLHSERKLVKKWVGDKIKELAERTLTGWLIKAEAPSLPERAEPAAEEKIEATDEAAAGKQEQEGEEEPNPQSGAMLKFLGKVGSWQI